MLILAIIILLCFYFMYYLYCTCNVLIDIPYTKINSKWIKDLNISCDTIKVLMKNTGSKISDIQCRNVFVDISPMAREIKERINKQDYIKLKSFFMFKENISKMKKEPTVWENIFANDTSDKGLISKIYKELT